MAVARGLFIQPTAGGVGTTPSEARQNLAGLLTPDGDLGVTPGILSGLTVTGVASGWTYQVSAGHAVTTRGATDGAVVMSVDGNTNTPAPVLADGSPGSTSAPVSGSRYELIWILQRDLDDGEADNIAALGVTQGTASGSPVRPAVPTGALVIAESLVPTGAANTAAGSVTITMVGAKVAARGGIIAASSTPTTVLGTPTAGVYADVAGSLHRGDGTTWKPYVQKAADWTSIASALGAVFVMGTGFTWRINQQADMVVIEPTRIARASTNLTMATNTDYTLISAGGIPAALRPLKDTDESGFVRTSGGIVPVRFTICADGSVLMMATSGVTLSVYNAANQYASIPSFRYAVA